MPIASQKVPWREDVVCMRVRYANDNSRSFVFCDKSINALHFCFRSVFTFLFQGHMKVALSSTGPIKSYVDLLYTQQNIAFLIGQ